MLVVLLYALKCTKERFSFKAFPGVIRRTPEATIGGNPLTELLQHNLRPCTGVQTPWMLGRPLWTWVTYGTVKH